MWLLPPDWSLTEQHTHSHRSSVESCFGGFTPVATRVTKPTATVQQEKALRPRTVGKHLNLGTMRPKAMKQGQGGGLGMTMFATQPNVLYEKSHF